MTTTTYHQLANSTYLDLDSYFNNGLSDGTVTGTGSASFAMNVALVLDRAADPATLEALLGSNWASRQKQLAHLGPEQVEATFGANHDDFQTVLDALHHLGLTTLGLPGSPQSGYVSSEASRTIWVQLGADDFQTLFHTPLLGQDPASDSGDFYWTGNLSLPDQMKDIVRGIWFDVADTTFGTVLPSPASPTVAALQQGNQGTGNGLGQPDKDAVTPQTIAGYYNFPLANHPSVPTDSIALLESGLGDTSPNSSTMVELINAYRDSVGIQTDLATNDVIGVQNGGTTTSTSQLESPERSLDVSVATAINPNSKLILYAGSGTDESAQSEPFTTYQSAIWDKVHNPSVISSSERFVVAQPSPGSPFLWAADQLFVDAALRNITVVSSSGDGGSSYTLANGLTNVTYTRSSPYGLVVGGTSISTVAAAAQDATLTTPIPIPPNDAYTAYYLDAVASQDPAVLWFLVAGGMTTMPSAASSSDWFIETVWNRYILSVSGTELALDPGYQGNESGNGGIDPTQLTPWFQAALSPYVDFQTSDLANTPGRGVPDVAAAAGGNMFYEVLTDLMVGNDGAGGTSAATPLWASLIVQLNAVFKDQGLPHLGYMTDLLYIAAAIAPASFNDVTVGDNTSSYLNGDSQYTSDGSSIIPTGYGYSAEEGYDLASGLGSPNGMLLARALTAIAHSQWSYKSVDAVLESDGKGGWQSGASQTLLVQSVSYGDPTTAVLHAGSTTLRLDGAATEGQAWTARFAGQALQTAFDNDLVTFFDRQSQGALGEVSVADGASLSATLDGAAATPWDMALTSPFGFADFQTSATTALRIARPVAIAEIPGGSGNTLDVVVRVRQDGIDDLGVTFYQVDDLNGTVDGLLPGDPNYAAQALAASNVYQLESGGTLLSGDGYGSFVQDMLVGVGAARHGVGAGQFIAMVLQNQTTGETFWGFAAANQSSDGLGHLWNYGLNTWGFEDQFGGGDLDYNDMVVQLDFTSAAGSGWLVI